jgi:hypothetical protein
MKKATFTNSLFICFMIFVLSFQATGVYCSGLPDTKPVISGLTYYNITQTGVTVVWKTDTPADSKIKWMAVDSNYQSLIFTDSLYLSNLVTFHVIDITNLSAASIYHYQVLSQNTDGAAVDSGYFVTQSVSSGKVDVYFNHSVDTTVSNGEKANGNINFETLLDDRINKANHSIDITLWEFKDITSVANALVNAKNRGVKIRFVYNYSKNTSLMDTLVAHGIHIQKRNFDTTYTMHDKFWIFDYRYNTSATDNYLWTGSTNVSYPQFHSDRNNVIVIQDQSLCAVYTREFEEMWGSHTDLPDSSRAKFGTRKANNTPHILNIGGNRMEVYFSPTDSVATFLSNLMTTRTTKSLFFCMLKFWLPSIEDSLHSLLNAGKLISGVFDESYSMAPNSAYPRMKGIADTNAWSPPADVFVDTIAGLLHHKYMIIDANSLGGNKITSTGSFNWEVAASVGNDENSLTIFDARVNNLYFQEFHQRYKESGGKLIGAQSTEYIPSPSCMLEQNYPNPFYTATTIKFTIAKRCAVKIVVYDMMGREVQTVTDEMMTPGTHEVSLNCSALTSGVYFYQLSDGDHSESKRMVVEKMN